MPCPPSEGRGAHQVYLLRAQTKLQKKLFMQWIVNLLKQFPQRVLPSLTFHARPNDISLKRHQASNDIYADCISMSSCSTSIRKSYWRGQFNMASTDWREVFESESESESRKLRLGWSFIQAAMEYLSRGSYILYICMYTLFIILLPRHHSYIIILHIFSDTLKQVADIFNHFKVEGSLTPWLSVSRLSATFVYI